MASDSRSRSCCRRRSCQQRQKVIRNWRGHNDVMQTRSFRGSGEPARVNASSNACERLGPGPRRALGPAAIRAASTGRTHDRTRPMLHQRKKLLSIRRRPHMTLITRRKPFSSVPRSGELSTSNARYLRGVDHCVLLGELVINPGLQLIQTRRPTCKEGYSMTSAPHSLQRQSYHQPSQLALMGLRHLSAGGLMRLRRKHSESLLRREGC